MWIAAGTVLAVSTVGSPYGLFYRYTGESESFYGGKIQIALQEPEWEKKADQDKNNIPDEAEHMIPLQTITKDPKVQNTGINDAYIFLTVEIPCRELITVNADGMKNPPGIMPLYSYEQDAS